MFKLSTDNGQSFLNNIGMSQTRADFDISHLTNNNYTCLLKGFYEEAQDGNGGNDTGSNVINALNYMTYGKGINQTTAEITDNPECWATVNPITVERGATYKISLNATHAWVFSFDDNDRFRTHLVLGNNTNPQEYTFTADTSKIRLGCYDPNKQLTYCTLTKEGSSSGGSGGSGESEEVNLLDGVNLVNYYVNNHNGEVQNAGVGSNTGAIKEFISVTGGKSYIFTADLNSTDVYEFRYAWYDSRGSFISCYDIDSTNPPYTLTAPSNAGSLRFHVAVTPNNSYTAVTNLSLKVKKDGTTTRPPSQPPSTGGLTGTYVFFGDSICYGGGTGGYGYPEAVKAVETGMTIHNYGVSGTCIAKNTTYDVSYPSILSKIQKTATYADYVVLEGGFNDAWASRNPLGTFKGGTAPTDSSAIVAYSNTLNEYQFADALEKCICEIKLKWWGKKIFYVIPHRMHENYNKQVIDLRSGGVAPTTDGTHPNKAGYDQYYAPPIINVLKANK